MRSGCRKEISIVSDSLIEHLDPSVHSIRQRRHVTRDMTCEQNMLVSSGLLAFCSTATATAVFLLFSCTESRGPYVNGAHGRTIATHSSQASGRESPSKRNNSPVYWAQLSPLFHEVMARLAMRLRSKASLSKSVECSLTTHHS